MTQPMIRSNRENVMQRMHEMGIDEGPFCQKLVETRCIIAGSFPLQCLLDETYENSDIDVYASVDAENGIYDMRLLHPFEKWLYKTYKEKHNPSYYIMNDVICSRKYQITEKACINVILVQQGDLEKFVLSDFDLSFCMTIFDGYDLKYDHLTLKKVGYVVNNQKKDFNAHHHKVSKDFDLSKLEGDIYGESVKNHPNPSRKRDRICCVYPDYEAWLNRRLEKYRSRGFTIINAPNNHQSEQVNKLEKQLSETQQTVKKISDFFAKLNVSGPQINKPTAHAINFTLIEMKMKKKTNQNQLGRSSGE